MIILYLHMKKFEYYIHRSYTDSEFAAALDELGNRGWELVNFVRTEKGDTVTKHIAVFKRECDTVH